MRRGILVKIALVLLLFSGSALVGCASHRVSFTVPDGPGEKTIQLKASSFAFKPNEIIARQGDRLVLQVENTVGIGHNLTMEDPQGNLLFSLVLPAGQTLKRELDLPQSGEYLFYCDKPLHSTMGMTGRIVVD